MKRRIATILTAACLLLSVFPCECFARDDAAVVTVETVGQTAAADAGDDVRSAGLDALYYWAGMTVSGDGSVTAPVLNAVPVSEPEELIYQALVTGIQAIAAGDQEEAVIAVPENTVFLSREDLGLTGPTYAYNETYGGWLLTTDAVQAADDWVREASRRVYNRLLTENPYVLYWHDKTKGSMPSWSKHEFVPDTDDMTENLDVGVELTFGFVVSADYAKRQTEPPCDYYTFENTVWPSMVDGGKLTKVEAAAAEAAKVVSDNAGKSDGQKLAAYRNYICGAVSYNDAAAAGSAAYGDPWQLISVFDKDNTTNVVCEGYAKAFKYLCDLTWTGTNPAVKCYLVSGYMSGGTGAGPHMWNVVTIGGVNYLADVTNCDTGTVGEGGELFLCGADKLEGDDSITYMVTLGNSQHIFYSYDEGTCAVYDVELVLSAEDLDPTLLEERPVGDVNGDYKRNVTDLERLFEHLGGEDPLESEALAYADVNGDGTVNILDYQNLYELTKK